MICQECNDGKAKYEDPRDPPLEEGECLCGDCYENALENEAIDLEEQLDNVWVELESYRNKKRKK